MATISILANTVRPSVDCRSDDTAFGAGTFSWQDPVHAWKAGPGEVMDIDMVMDCEKKITFCTQIKVHFLVVILVFVCSHSEALGVDELSLNFVV